MTELTQDHLKSILRYEPDKGNFYWLNQKWKARSINLPAGSGLRPTSNYRRIKIGQRSYLCHRLAWLYVYGYIPAKGIDHLNGDESDNRIANLREAAQEDNLKNKKLYTKNKTGIHGIHITPAGYSWSVQIGVKCSRVKLGTFHDFFEACCTRKAAENKYGYYKNHGIRK